MTPSLFRYAFGITTFLFLLLAPSAFIHAGNTVSVNTGEAMKTIDWVVAEAPSCTPSTDYPANADNISATWSSTPKSGLGSLSFGGVNVGAAEGTYYFRCAVPADTDTAYLRVCNNVTNQSDGGAVCIPKSPVNTPPNANAGNSVTIILPTTVASPDGAGASDNGTFTILWTNTVTPGAVPTITGGTTLTPSFANLTTPGVYTFNMRVTDNDGVVVNRSMTVTVNPPANVAPTANAGVDQTITPPVETANTSGANARDPDGTITILWSNVSTPGSVPAIAGAGTLSPTFSNLTTSGVYVFNMRVTDNASAVVNDTVNVTVNNPPPAVCTGVVPAFATIYPGDQVGFMGDVPVLYSSVNTARKCEYTCNTAYWWNGGACVLPDLSTVSTGPGNGVTVYTDAAMNFTGTVSNSNTAPVTQGGWADLEIDWYNDNAGSSNTGGDNFDNNYNANSGVQLGSFSNPGSKPLSYNLSAPIPVGTHRYRFNADVTGGAVIESDENNNRSAWRTFTAVIRPPEKPANVQANATAPQCGGQLNVRWNASARADTYEISLDNGSTWPAAHRGISGTSRTISSLPVDTVYNIRVRARNTTDVSVVSDSVSGTASSRCEVLSGTGCTIDDGSKSCTGRVSWDLTGILLPSIYNRTTDTPIGNTVLETDIPLNLVHDDINLGVNSIQKRDDGVAFGSVLPLTAACRVTSFFHPGYDECRPRPDIDVSVIPSTALIRTGNMAEIRTKIKVNYPLSCTFSGNAQVPPLVTNGAIAYAGSGAEETFSKNTKVLTSAQIIQINCRIPGFSAAIDPLFTDSVRIDVVTGYVEP